MSRQSKAAKKAIIAENFKHNRGPSTTVPHHGKVRTWKKAGRPFPSANFHSKIEAN